MGELNHKIRISRTEDVELIQELDEACFGDTTYPIKDPELCTWWIARNRHKEPLAYAGIKDLAEPGGAYLCRAGVLPIARGLGLQKRLIRVRLAWARRNGRFWVCTDTRQNPASANSLIACGFKSYEPADPWGDQFTVYWIKKITMPPLRPSTETIP